MKISPERHLHNIGQFGNCVAAGAPSVLSQNWDRFSDGDLITTALVGAGLAWGGFIIEN
jgi:3-oxoacyl-[acyl-carrier-protein] synthase III